MANSSENINTSIYNYSESTTLIDKSLIEKIRYYEFNIFMLSQSIEKIKTSIEVGKERIKQDQLKQLKYSREIDKLKRQVTKYNNILNCHNSEIEHFESEIAKMKQENLTSSEMMNHINSEENYYNLIFQIKFFENALNSNEKNDNILNVYQLFKKEILDIFDDKNVLEENLNSKLKTNELNYDNLKIKFNKYEEEINKTNLCINCHNSFILKDNDDKSCLYHPGDLKFYSCRGCGSDEYYTCCLKCSTCNKGCKQSKHILEK